VKTIKEKISSFWTAFANKVTHMWMKFRQTDGYNTLMGSLFAITVGLILGIIIIILVNPSKADVGILRLLKGFFNHPRGAWIGIGQLLYRSTPIIFTGLAVAFAFKTGLFNIGASGQYTVGLFVASLIGILGDSLGNMQWIVAVLGGMAAGFVWGAIPGIFKAFFNVHEVITSIMFNYIGMYLVNGLLNSNFLRTKVINGTTNRTLVVDQAAKTPYGPFNAIFPNSGMDISFLIAIGVAIVLFLVLNKTVFGRELKSVGLNRSAAKYAGVNEKRSLVLSMAIAGMVAGLGGALFILAPSVRNLGNAYAVENTILTTGFKGIPVALLANSNPLGVILSTMFVEYISLGGMSMQSVGFVSEIVDIIIGVILYFSAFALIMTQYFGKFKDYLAKKKALRKESDV
jgi:simple sugar transport system permease protein